jgi:NTE family protein
LTGGSLPSATDPTAPLSGYSPTANGNLLNLPASSPPAFWYDTQPPRPKLSQGQVTHLALEGGGGKGFAFLGAIQALEDLGVLAYSKDSSGRQKLDWQIQGLSGSSAGAITAMLLGSGMNSSDIQGWMTSTAAPPAGANFASFFDPASPRQDWSGKPINETQDESGSRQSLAKWLPRLALLSYVLADKVAATTLTPPPASDSGLETFFTVLFELIEGASADAPLPVAVMAKDLNARLAWLDRDCGIFSGAYAYNAFDQLLRSRYYGTAGGTDPVTFNQHASRYGVALAITGSNLTTGKTVWFRSGGTTGEIPVAAAVRASMSLPFLFKPVSIDSPDTSVKGVYVDGGVWNNTPVAAFDTNLDQPTTLVLRLDIDTTSPIDVFKSFASRYLGLTAGGSGETQFGVDRAFQAIELDTTGLATVNFTPSQDAQTAAVTAAYKATVAYFQS